MMMDERQRIEQAIAAQESLRGTMDDSIIDEAIVILRDKLTQLETTEQQRKLVTILYADIVGSTNIVKHLDPEDALEIMDGSLKRLAVPVEQHGGHVARFMGDGFKAVFGMPQAQENDPEMAIKAGLGILEVAHQLGADLDNQRGIQDFQVRVGINTGLAALGGMTEAEDTVMGSTVNLAKRVESAAPSGGLLITHNTYRHVRGIFNVQLHEPIEAKGFDEQVQVYLVENVKPRTFRVQTRGVEGVETRMVGRDVEFHALHEAYRNAIEGEHTQVVTIVGEAGVGKSRLLYEFQNWIELLPEGVWLFQGRGRQETQNLPYALLKDLFTIRFQIQESDKAREVQEKIEAGFGEVLGVDEEVQLRTHIIGQLLGFDFSESQHVRGILDDPRQIHDRALMYLAEYFQRMSEQSPTVIFLEDIHWADDSSLDMLNRLARRIPEQCLLIVCVARHRLFERRPYWGEGQDYHTQLELSPLSKTKSRGLVREILQKVDQVPDVLQELVVKGAEGNPFYIEELIKMLIEDGFIITAEEMWRVEPDRLVEVDVPDTLTGVLQARLEGLPQEERSALQQASVVGHIFWDEAVEYISTESSSADTKSIIRSTGENLSSLRSRELIYHREESAFTDAAEYTFKHAILRDVTYESVLKRVRKIYHGMVAEWLIQHSGERPDEYAGLIADHLDLAGKDEQAAIYLYQAGESAAKRYANEEAVEYFSRALALKSENDLIGRYDILLSREKVYHILGNRKKQFKDLAALKEMAEALGDKERQAKIALEEAEYASQISDFPAVVRAAETTIDLTRDEGFQSTARFQWGRALYYQGDLQAAQRQLEQAVKLAQSAQSPQAEADSLRNLGNVLGEQGDAERGITLNEQSMRIACKIGDRKREATVLNNLTSFFLSTGEHRKANECCEQALQIFREIGDRKGEGLSLDWLGEIFFSKGEYDKARDCYERSLRIGQEVRDRANEGEYLLGLGWIALDQGEYDNAKTYFEHGLQSFKENDIHFFDQEGYLLFGWLNFHQGAYDTALSNFKQSMDIIREKGYQEDMGWNYLAQSLIYQKLGDNEAALEYSQLGLRAAQEFGPIAARVLMTLGHILVEVGELAEAIETYQEAIALMRGSEIHHWAMEPLAGLARVSLAQGELSQALSQVDEILRFIETRSPSTGHALDGTIEPFRILLTCCQVLKANNDLRADAILTEAYNLLQARATNISDEGMRGCFLNNVAVNREILEEYEKNRLGALKT
jgi:class 3 adenylate cyclase/tetratricopeptide (TPR) repeat protein